MSLPNTKSSLKGFTLVELMVAIAIVAILAAVGFTIFSNTQRSARDAKRRTDIESIGQAMENHYRPIGGDCDGFAGASPQTTNPTYCPLQAEWFTANEIPNDPNPGLHEYCVAWILQSETGTDIIPNVADADAWAGDTCPPGWSLHRDAIDVDIPPQNVVADGIKGYKVCAVLEDPNSTPKIVCRGSQQQ